MCLNSPFVIIQITVSDQTVANLIKSVKEVKKIDQTDQKIIRLLQENARMSFSEIGNRTSLSTPAVSNRVQKLKEQGIIKGYTAILDAQSMGRQLVCFCQIYLPGRNPTGNQLFLDAVSQEPDIWEAYCISGDYEYLLKIVTASAQTLESLLSRLRTKIPAVKTKSSVVLSSLKEPPSVLG